MREALALIAMILLGIFTALQQHTSVNAFSVEVPASAERLAPLYQTIDTLRDQGNTGKLTALSQTIAQEKNNFSSQSHIYKSLVKIEQYINSQNTASVLGTKNPSALSPAVLEALAELF